MYYDCIDCIYATNSRGLASKHRDETGHELVEEND